MAQSDIGMNELRDALTKVCGTSCGGLDSQFLCKSVGSLALKPPICVTPETTVADAVKQLQIHKVGAVLILDERGKVLGIFTERDCVLKVTGTISDLSAVPVRDVMTPEPVCQEVQSTLAYVLVLMSHGGFRHIPIVDEGGEPIGVVSVKDVIDSLVSGVTDSLLGFPEGAP